MNTSLPIAFYLNQPVNLEKNRQVEFKEITAGNKDPGKTITNHSPEYAVAYLNDLSCTGGSIYWGIRDKDRCVIGVHFDHRERDDLRKKITTILDKIQPALTPNAYAIDFHSIIDLHGEASENLKVVELSIKAPTSKCLYFAGGKKAYVKNDAGRKELSGLELVNEIKRRENIATKSDYLWEFSEFLAILTDIKPLLYWIDKAIPQKETQPYFAAMQVLFNGNQRFFKRVSDNLLYGTDNLLRVLSILPTYDDYSGDKLAISFECYIKYTNAKQSVAPDTDRFNTKEKFRHVNTSFRNMINDGNYKTHEEKLCLTFIITLIDFFLECIPRKKSMIVPVIRRALTDNFQNLILPIIESNFATIFPRKDDKFYNLISNDIQNYCESSWLLFKKRR